MNIHKVVDIAERLRGADTRRNEILWFNDRLKELFSEAGYVAYGIERNYEQPWFRGRICSSADGFPSLVDCICPPPEVTKLGRANLAGQSVFYGSWNLGTVMAEMQVSKGQFVHVICARPRVGFQVPCTVIGELQSVYNSGSSLVNSEKLAVAMLEMIKSTDNQTIDAKVFVDAFLAEQYGRIVAKPSDYKLTAACAQFFLRANGGIIYPSVERRGGINLALPAHVFDERFEVIWTAVYAIKDYYGYGITDATVRRFATKSEKDGRIDWSSSVPPTMTTGRYGGASFSKDLKGWSAPPR